MAKKTKATFKPPVDEPLSPIQKGFLIAVLSFIPFAIFVLLPWLTRNYILNTLHVPANLLDSQPKEVNLVQTGNIPAAMKFTINGVEFQVPRDLTPVLLRKNTVTLRASPRRVSRTISCGSFPKAKEVDLRSTGAIAWVIPSDMKRFLDTVLLATWNPARILCKAQFLISQGIQGEIFRTTWETDFSGYVFPLPGDTGYLGKIFRNDRPEYVEFASYDELHPVSLRDWVNFAFYITVQQKKDAADSYQVGTLTPLLEKASTNNASQWEVVQSCLHHYFQSDNPYWVLPIAHVLESRGFFREMIEFHHYFAPLIREDLVYNNLWNDVLDRALHRVLKMDIDPHLRLNRLMVHCQNLGEFAIGRLKMTITLENPKGDREFDTVLFVDNFLHVGMAKDVEIAPPPGVSLHDAKGISWKVEDVLLQE